MKTVFLFFLLAFSVPGFTQKLAKANELLKTSQLLDAKKEIDGFFTIKTGNNDTLAEAYYVKSKIYNAIASDPKLARQFPRSRMDAFTAIKRYTELEGKMLISLQVDGYKPINDIYTGFYQEAANNFNTKEFMTALEGFVNAINVSEFMYEKKWITLKLDTNSVLYAGVSAEKLNLHAEAAHYYSKLADHRVKGEGFVEIYKWVSNYYFENKNQVLAQKYLAIGRQVYPQDPFWNSLELDMVRGEGKPDKLFALYEKTIVATPDNHLYRYNYAVELYQHAYNTEVSKRPANSEQMIAKAEAQLQETIRLSPSYIKGQIFAGQIKYNKGVDLLSESKTAPETLKKDLKTKAIQQFTNALPYLLRAERLIASKADVNKNDKLDLKEIFDLIITIYDQTGEKEKKKEYEIKFNAVKTD